MMLKNTIFSRALLLSLLLSFLSISACTVVDNYLLGKDNTPKPDALQQIQGKVNLDELWSISTNSALKFKSKVKLKPAVQGNRLYVVTHAGRLMAVDIQSGHIAWEKELGEPIISGPTVESGYIVLGTGKAGLIALKQSNGERLWHATLSSDVLAKPAIGANHVVVKTIDGQVYAFQLSNGKREWVVDHGSPSLILRASSAPVILDNAVFVGFSDARVKVIDLPTGRVLWERNIAYPRGSSDVERLIDIDADPIVRNGVVYLAAYQGQVGALSMKNGEFLWTKPISVYKNMTLDTQALFITDSDDVVWSLTPSTGQVRWKQTGFNARQLTGPALMGQWIFVGDKTGYLHVLSGYNGEVIGRTALSGGLTVEPVVSGRRVFVITSNGKLTCYSLSPRRTTD